MELPDKLENEIKELKTVTGMDAEEILRQALDNYRAKIGKQLISQQAQAQRLQKQDIETDHESDEPSSSSDTSVGAQLE